MMVFSACALGKSSRISPHRLTSPLSSLSFCAWPSPRVAAICHRADRSLRRPAQKLLANVLLLGCDEGGRVFPRPLSTRRRIASDREAVLFFAAQASISSINGRGSPNSHKRISARCRPTPFFWFYRY